MIGWFLRAAGVAALVAPLLVVDAGASLDGWIVGRYRGSQLLADSAAATPSLAHSGPRPRIEAVRAGRRADTLFAVHFSAMEIASLLDVGGRATLAAPTGTITPLTVQVLARRRFRTPRAPGAPSMPDSNWRHGWAYLVIVPHVDGRPSGRYRGWTLLEASEPAPKRRGVARP